MYKYLIIALFIVSCGSRKSEISKTKEIVKTDVVKEVKNDIVSESNTKIDTSSETNEITIEPVDKEKEFIYNGTTVKNARIKVIKVKTNKKVIKNEKTTDKSIIKSKETQQRKSNAKAKTTEREHSIFQYWWVLLILALYLIYRNRSSIIKRIITLTS